MSELEIWNELGNLYFSTGSYDEAVRAYHKAIELDHGSGQSYSNLASIYIQKERFAEAVPLLKKALELTVGQAERAKLWKFLGNAWLGLDDYANAEAAYRNAVELEPDNAAARADLARLEAGKAPAAPASEPRTPDPQDTQPIPAEALPKPDDVEESGPNEPPAQAGLEAAEPQAACWVYQDETPPAPTDGNAGQPEASPVLLGSPLLSENNPEAGAAPDQAGEAVTAEPLPQAAAPEPIAAELTGTSPSSPNEAGPNTDGNDPTSPASQVLIGNATGGRAEALLQLGIQATHERAYGQATRFLHSALAIAADLYDNHLEARCYTAIASLQAEQGSTESALHAYESAASLAADENFPWNDLGRAYSSSERYEEAITAFQKAIEHNPKDPASWNGLGDVYHKLGRNEDAIAAYQLGNVFDQQSRQAAAQAEPTVEAVSLQAEKWKEVANVYYDLGEDEQAAAAYLQALDRLEDAPAKAVLWDRLGEIYRRLGREEESAQAFRRASTLDPEEIPQEAAPVEAKDEPAVPPAAQPEEPTVQLEQPAAQPEAQPAPAADEEPATIIMTDEPAAPAPEVQADAAPADGVPAGRPEAPYWVFEPSQPVKKIPRPSTPYKAVAADSPTASIHSSPALPLSQFTGEVLLDEREPEAATPAGEVALAEEEPAAPEQTGLSIDEEFEGPAVTIDTNVPNPIPTDFRTLENDIAAYRRVTEINPKNDRAWDALGNMYEAVGMHSEAIAAFEKAIELSPRKEVYYYHLGLAHASQLHYDKAIQALKKVIKINPEYMLAHCAIAGFYRRIGKDGEAKHHVAIARPSIANENEYNQACFESISGDVDRSIAFLKLALEKQQVQMEWVRNDPDLDFIRTDPRFETLLRKFGSR